MKKIVLTVALIASVITATNSQTSIDDVYSCVSPLFENLTVCFISNDVTGTFRGTGTTLYFQSDAGIPYTQMSGCVDTYNKDRVICPTAPLLVLGSYSKTKKTAAQ